MPVLAYAHMYLKWTNICLFFFFITKCHPSQITLHVCDSKNVGYAFYVCFYERRAASMLSGWSIGDHAWMANLETTLGIDLNMWGGLAIAQLFNLSEFGLCIITCKTWISLELQVNLLWTCLGQLTATLRIFFSLSCANRFTRISLKSVPQIQ